MLLCCKRISNFLKSESIALRATLPLRRLRRLACQRRESVTETTAANIELGAPDIEVIELLLNLLKLCFHVSYVARCRLVVHETA